MTSISQLYKKPETRGEIKVNKSFMVPIEKLFMEDGFNVRDLDYEHAASIGQAYRAGDHVPPLVVQVQPNGTMKIIDGHHRYQAIIGLIETGVEFPRVQCESFSGAEADQLSYMIKSSQGRNLSAVERGMAYKRLESHGFTRDEISTKVGRSRNDITHHIDIADLPDETRRQIKNGEVSASLAHELHNSGGAEAVTKAVNGAKANGKAKATRKDTSLWKPAIGKNVVGRLAEARIEKYDDGVSLHVSPEDWKYIEDAISKLGIN